MANERESCLGGYARQLEVELFARDVLVGIAMQRGVKGCERLEVLQQLGFVKGRGTGYGYGLMSCGEQTPAITCPLGDVEGFVGTEQLDDREVVKVTLGPFGEAETRLS